jgi:hypothetical protein
MGIETLVLKDRTYSLKEFHTKYFTTKAYTYPIRSQEMKFSGKVTPGNVSRKAADKCILKGGTSDEKKGTWM